MFDQTERQTVPGDDLYGTVRRVADALYATGQIQLAQVSPASWLGKGPEVGLGMVMKATVLGYPGMGSFALDIKLEVELEDKGIAFLYASWVVCLPVAPFLFLYAYNDANTRRRALFDACRAAIATPSFSQGSGFPPDVRALPPAG